VEQACSSSAIALTVWPAAFTVNQGTHGAPWWTSGVPPTWTDIISCAPERQVDWEEIPAVRHEWDGIQR